MTPGGTSGQNPRGTRFPDLPGQRRARLLWGVGIGMVVGFFAAVIRWDTRTWHEVLARMAASGAGFGICSWLLDDDFWRSPWLWLAATMLAGAILAFF